MTSGGSQGWVSDYDQFFKHVATSMFVILRMFLVHNNPHGMEHFETHHATPRNIRCQLQTSLLVSMDVHMVDNCGFTQLLSSKVGDT